MLHFTVFVWGFTAILGELISLEALPLVWYRMLFAAVSLFFYLIYMKRKFNVGKNKILTLLGIGAMVGLHWLFFFASIKASTVSVALVCLSSATLFTSLLQPLLRREKIQLLEILIGVIILCGIFLIFHFETQYTEGILWGLSAAFMASFFTILNEKVVKTTKAGIISFYEMIGGFALMTLVILLFTDKASALDFNLSKEDYIYLIILSTVCTAFAYVLGVRVMEKLSAYTVVLTTNLEPIYGIILAFLFFGETEKMTPGFYLGGLIILLGVFLYPIFNRKRAKRLLSRKMH